MQFLIWGLTFGQFARMGTKWLTFKLNLNKPTLLIATSIHKTELDRMNPEVRNELEKRIFKFVKKQAKKRSIKRSFGFYINLMGYLQLRIQLVTRKSAVCLVDALHAKTFESIVFNVQADCDLEEAQEAENKKKWKRDPDAQPLVEQTPPRWPDQLLWIDDLEIMFS